MSEEKTTNLFHANSVNTDDNDFRKNKIIDGVRYGLYDYRDYINKSIEVIQKDGAIRIPLSQGDIRYYLVLHKLSLEEKEAVNRLLFKTKIKQVVINNSNIKANIYKRNELENYLVFKTDKEIDSISITINNKEVKVNTTTSIVYYLETDKLRNRDSRKVDMELFERNTSKVYTEQPSANHKDNRANELRIITRNADERFIVLQTTKINSIYLRANDYQLQMQKRAIETLMKKPLNEHTPLQKLFDLSSKAESYFENNIDYLNEEPDWKILNKPEEYDGTYEQQDFVIKALKTKDFALLEGPPGSGKTTAIIELIIQLIKQNKKVLLVSATHVAVDNVIHRILTNFKKECEGLVVPIRIASDIGSIRKKSVEPYELKTFIKKTKENIYHNLSKRKKTKSSTILIDGIKEDNKEFDNIILKSANLVGGTMIGILKHPDIKQGGIQEMFDVMIVDESSKVTFLDFIVPALYAKKWILVGDVNQLSPYTEDDFINENIDNILKDKNKKTKLISSFEIERKLASTKKWDKESVKILFSNNHNENDFPNHSVFQIPTVFETNYDNILNLNSVDIIIAKPSNEHKQIITDHVFVKAILFEDKISNSSFKNRQKFFHKNRSKRRGIKHHRFEFSSDKNQEWKEMVGNILSQMYQYRFEHDLAEGIKQEYDFLVPDNIQNDIEKIRRVALPSILELLQIGVGEKTRIIKQTGEQVPEDKLIYKGFDEFEEIKKNKFQSLSYQHRMEDEIASIPREHFYKGKNLETANTIAKRINRIAWYKPNENKVIWVSNKDISFRKEIIRKNSKKKETKNYNPTEVNDIEIELEEFIRLANQNPLTDSKKYEIAILSFYSAQIIELKIMLRKLLPKQNKNHKYFTTKNVEITLSTVDKFQGDEADIVLLSFTKFTKKAFYNSPNRLNVALTRARHKLILYGNKEWLGKNAQLKALQKIASEKDSRLTR